MSDILTLEQLLARRRAPLAGKEAMTLPQVEAQMAAVAQWRHADGRISRVYTFRDYHQTSHS